MSGISGVSSYNYTSYGNFASGKKINSAADGAAELSIIEREDRQIGGLDAGAGNMQSATQNASNWAAVPEPTSGLLMLIGIAGLALRRRRA